MVQAFTENVMEFLESTRKIRVTTEKENESRQLRENGLGYLIVHYSNILASKSDLNGVHGTVRWSNSSPYRHAYLSTTQS